MRGQRNRVTANRVSSNRPKIFWEKHICENVVEQIDDTVRFSDVARPV
jgi:hypothetical protein